MKICIIGPGIMPIPPTGWGAVEILIHDIRCELENLGHEVVIVNVRDKNQIIQQANQSGADFVHVQYDEHIDVVPYLNCRNIAITSHYGYLEQPHRWDSGYRNLVYQFANIPVNIFCLSPGIAKTYTDIGLDPSRIYVVHNGVRDDLFKFNIACEYPDRTIYLAKIDYRKRQHVFQTIPNLYYAGNLADDRFNANNDRYLGEWSKEYLYNNLTRYANLALLSDGEAHPLVCLEAMSAGLGIVISEYSCGNLDLDKEFIDVIPETKMQDLQYIESVLSENAKKSITMRAEIRAYAEEFSWNNVVKSLYIPRVIEVMSKPREANAK